MKFLVRALIITTITALPARLLAESHYSWYSSTKQSWANAEGSDFHLLSVNTGVYFALLDSVKPGLSLTYEYSDSKTNLFDHYVGGGINADLLIEGPSFSSFLPFLLIRIPVFHRFQAGGKITRRITNGTDREDGTIEFPSSTPGTISTSSPRVDKFGYELNGSALGIGVDAGCGFKISDTFTIKGALGYSWRNMVLKEAKGSGYSMVGYAEYSYDQRHGLTATGKNIEEGYDVDADRRSRLLRAFSLTMGIDYAI